MNVKAILWSAHVLVYPPSARLWFSSWTRTQRCTKEANWNLRTHTAKIRRWQQSLLFIDLCLRADRKTLSVRASGSTSPPGMRLTRSMARHKRGGVLIYATGLLSVLHAEGFCFINRAQGKCSWNLLTLLWLINGVGGFAGGKDLSNSFECLDTVPTFLSYWWFWLASLIILTWAQVSKDPQKPAYVLK